MCPSVYNMILVSFWPTEDIEMPAEVARLSWHQWSCQQPYNQYWTRPIVRCQRSDAQSIGDSILEYDSNAHVSVCSRVGMSRSTSNLGQGLAVLLNASMITSRSLAKLNNMPFCFLISRICLVPCSSVHQPLVRPVLFLNDSKALNGSFRHGCRERWRFILCLLWRLCRFPPKGWIPFLNIICYKPNQHHQYRREKYDREEVP